MSEHVRIYEVSPRDGLQNEKRIIPAQDKIKLVNMLSDCGFKNIEVTSFVSPKWVPQLADAAEVMAGITRKTSTVYGVLTPNMRGLEGALASKAGEIAIFTAASESFCKKNTNCSIEESFERFAPVAEAAKSSELPVRGYISCVTDCPYEGKVEPQKVAEVAAKLIELGAYEISLGDTIGHGKPETVSAMLDAVSNEVSVEKLAGHFHDTLGTALSNVEVSLEKGVRCFDSSAGGLGGCPYAPGAAGNVDTGSVLQLLDQLGYETGINVTRLEEAEAFAKSLRA